jgi:O-acetyl-ADP-ribose deacetylase (regulator of RNase III)
LIKVVVGQGDVLDEQADVLICTANPMLRMSGGVNGAILLRGGSEVQEELDEYLKRIGVSAVEPGSIVRTAPGPLSVNHILHAVGVTLFYESSVELISRLLTSALKEAAALGARTVATPALATGYGPLTLSQFGSALAAAIKGDFPPVDELRVVLRRREDMEEVLRALQGR